MIGQISIEQVLAVLGYVLTLSFIPIILSRKRDPTAALGWCLTVAFLPYVGVLIYLTFGQTRVHHSLKLRREHREFYAGLHLRAPDDVYDFGGWEGLASLAGQLGGYPRRPRNAVTFFSEGVSAYEAMLQAIDDATDHVYIESFIWNPDQTGLQFIERLTEKAAAGVHVRVLYDDLGSHKLSHSHWRGLIDAGGVVVRYPPMHAWRRRLQISLRNHRKILTVDGSVGFTGGLNIGDEYVHKGPFRFWRDTHVRIEGPGATDLERAFAENWEFVAGERLPPPELHDPTRARGAYPVQIVTSGPDQETNAIHALYFAAIARARERLWIMSPYFVPDPALMTALQVAARLGVDVRLLAPRDADHWLSYFAANYYWESILASGVRIFRYGRGMMHSKVIMVDGQWASVGTANLDIRSLRLNFEVNAVFDDPGITEQLERQFEADLLDADEMNLGEFRARPLYLKLIENVSRLFSPVL